MVAGLHALDVGHEVGHLHAGEGFKEGWDLGGDFGHFASNFAGTCPSVVAGGDDGDFADLAERLCHGSDDVGHVGDELVDDCGLGPFLVGCGFDVHDPGFGFLHLDLLLFLDLKDLDLFGDDLLLHDAGLELVGLVGLGLLSAALLGELSFPDVEGALSLGLLGERGGFGDDALLVRGGLGNCGFAVGH